MKLLLDTHAFIWFDAEPECLPEPLVATIADPATEVWLSVVSVWEMMIKSQAGKLSLSRPLGQIIDGQREMNNIQIIPVRYAHVLAVGDLALYHRDPFDRMLIAQSAVERMTLVSRDAAFAAYGIDVLW